MSEEEEEEDSSGQSVNKTIDPTYGGQMHGDRVIWWQAFSRVLHVNGLYIALPL